MFDMKSFCFFFFFLLCIMAGVWRFEWCYCSKPPSSSVLFRISAGFSALCVCAQSPPTLTPWTVAHQAPLSMGFPRQKCRFLLQGIFDPASKPASLVFSCIGRQLLYHWRHLGSPFSAFHTKERRSTINAHCQLISVVSYSDPMDLFHCKMLFHYSFYFIVFIKICNIFILL